MNQTPTSYLLCNEIQNYLRDHTEKLHDKMLTYPEYNFNYPYMYKDYEDQIFNLDCFQHDVWLVTYPKTGTTWTQEMIWLIANNLDYNGAKVELHKRAYYLEQPAFLNSKIFENLFEPTSGEDWFQQLQVPESPTFIKSHLPAGLLPQKLWEVKSKIIYLLRNPKDVAASFLNHYRLFSLYTGTEDMFFEAFLSDNVFIGSYWAHVASFWKLRHEPNILIIRYEDMKHDLPSAILKMANFLGKTIPDDEMDKLIDHLSFKNMKNNDSVNFSYLEKMLQTAYNNDKNLRYLNKGIVGNFKQVMSEEWITRFTEWERKEKVKYNLTDEDFPY